MYFVSVRFHSLNHCDNFICSKSNCIHNQLLERQNEIKNKLLSKSQTLNATAMRVNNFGQPAYELPTVVLRGQSKTAANIRLKEILKRKALFGNQTSVIFIGGGASNPSF